MKCQLPDDGAEGIGGANLFVGGGFQNGPDQGQSGPDEVQEETAKDEVQSDQASGSIFFFVFSESGRDVNLFQRFLQAPFRDCFLENPGDVFREFGNSERIVRICLHQGAPNAQAASAYGRCEAEDI